MLARAVDSLERFFVQQARHMMLLCDLLHELHRELVVIHGNVGRGEDGSKLMLCGSDLVVFGLGKDSVRPERLIKVTHKVGNARLEHAEIVILKLLSACGRRAEQRTSCQDKILAAVVHILVNEEILLLGPDRRGYSAAVDAEKL